MNVSNADPLFGIGAIRQIGQQQGGGIRQGEAVNRLFAVPARRFQRLREQKHAADLRAAVDIAEMHVLPRHIDAYARADAFLVDPRAGGDGDDCAIEQEKPRGEHAAGGERQADDGEGQSQFAGAQKHHRAGEERQRRAGDEQQHVHGGLPPERAEGIDGMLARRGKIMRVYVCGDRAEAAEKRLERENIPCQSCGNYDKLIESLRDEDNFIFILPTYTAMLELRAKLVRRLGGKNFWE